MYYVKEDLNLNAFGILKELVSSLNPVTAYSQLLELIPTYFTEADLDIIGMYAFGMDGEKHTKLVILKKANKDEIGFMFHPNEKDPCVYTINKDINAYLENKRNIDFIKTMLEDLYLEQKSKFIYDKRFFKSLEEYQEIKNKLLSLFYSLHDDGLKIIDSNNINNINDITESMYDVGIFEKSYFMYLNQMIGPPILYSERELNIDKSSKCIVIKIASDKFINHVVYEHGSVNYDVIKSKLGRVLIDKLNHRFTFDKSQKPISNNKNIINKITEVFEL